jgi:lysophospholipase L1-like esterase
MADPSLTSPTAQLAPANRRRGILALLIVSLSINALGIGYMTLRVKRKGGLRYLLERLDLRDASHPMQPFQEDWRARWRKYPNTEGEIIFVGDSIVGGGPWSEFYSPIKNRGIGGETTAGVLDRLDEITESHPRKVFLLIGTNCLAVDIPVAQVVRNYRKILERIRDESPRTKTYLIGVLPVNQHFPQGPVHDNGTIRDLNNRLKQLAGEIGNVEYIDASAALTDQRGDLREELSNDGLHLSLDGYLVLGKLLEPYVTEAESDPAARSQAERERGSNRHPHAAPAASQPTP